MRHLMLFVVVACFAAPLVAQEKKDAVQAAKPCDMAKIEDGKYCAKCKKVLVRVMKVDGKTEASTDFDKDGNCKECKSTPEKCRVCLKEWIPRCGMHDMQPHEKCCCDSKFCCKAEIVVSQVTFKCEGCGATGMTEEGVKHGEKEHDKKLTKTCAKSGTFPHGGELPKPK